MTRINTMQPSQLSREHLMGENKEITRVYNLVRARIAKGHKPSDIKIPDQYTLNTGHVTFFYNKLEFIYNRHTAVVEEMLNRGYEPDLELYNDICDDAIKDFYGTDWWNDWEPTIEDNYLCWARITNQTAFEKVIQEKEQQRL